MTTTFQRILNGWKVNTAKLKSVMETINREAGVGIFDPITVTNTDSILLYQVSFYYTLTQEGVDRLLGADKGTLKKIISTYGLNRYDAERIAQLVDWYHGELKKVKTELSKKEPEDGMKRYHKWLKAFQDDVTIIGLEQLVGKDNLAYQGRVEGFRQGDENGDSPIFSDVYGELPLPLQVSPSQQIMQNWGILEGELLANWMMERAI